MASSLLFFLLASILLGTAPCSHAPDEKCPIGRVRLHNGQICGKRGWIRNPQTISNSTQANLMDCVAECFGNKHCKTFRYLEDSAVCYLYSALFEEMSLTFDNRQHGLVYDRDCYSNDCKILANLKAVENCRQDYYVRRDNYGYEYYYYYRLFAVGYGKTARHINFEQQTYVYNGTLEICDVVDESIALEALDIYYYLPTNQWVVTYYDYEHKPKSVEEGHFRMRNNNVTSSYTYIFEYEEGSD